MEIYRTRPSKKNLLLVFQIMNAHVTIKSAYVNMFMGSACACNAVGFESWIFFLLIIAYRIRLHLLNKTHVA